MSFRNGDRSRANRMRRQKLKRRKTIAAFREGRTAGEKTARKPQSKRAL